MRVIGYSIIGAILAAFILSGKQEKRTITFFQKQEARSSIHIIKEPEEELEELLPLTKTFGIYNLTSYEWEILGQVIMAEARGESFEVQYYIACTILNRVESELFPNTIAGVIYQTKPAIQFYGAWDMNQYKVTDSVWEAIQAALLYNDLPSDIYYFTSDGYLPGTEAWKQMGNMWFFRQKNEERG